ncbi:MAG TPA: prepilin peptidase [Acidimicrobiales bacterium]|nr:prepilin peptidase [Acidimicrobiales bacterium]
MTALLIFGAALYGIAVGSFLNVVVYRVPAGLSIVRPPSACPGCGHAIEARDNIPVLSWLVLRGRCRHCRAPISARYPVVEILTGAVWVAVALRFGWSWTLPAELVLVTGLVALAFIDFDHLKLPKVIVWPLGLTVAALLVLAAAVEGTWHRLLVAVICAAVEFAVLFAINFASPRSLGFGDVRLGPVIGLALGWLGWRYAFWGFLAANILGVIAGLGLMALRRAGRKTPIPYGVFLAAGAFLALLFAGSVHYPA